MGRLFKFYYDRGGLFKIYYDRDEDKIKITDSITGNKYIQDKIKKFMYMMNTRSSKDEVAYAESQEFMD